MKNNTSPDDLLSYKFSDKLFLCSGRKTPAELSKLPLVFGYRGEAVVYEDIKTHADWVIIDTTDTPYFSFGDGVGANNVPIVNQMVQDDRDSFQLVYTTTASPILEIYQVR